MAACGVGYADGGLFVRQGEHFEQYKMKSDGESFNLITSLAVTPKDEVWAGTLGLGLIQLKDGLAIRHTTENGLSDDEITAVAAQGDGSIWAGTSAGMVHHLSERGIDTFEQQVGRSNAPVSCILATSSGNIFLGSESGLVARLVEEKFVLLNSTSVLEGAPVRALYEDGVGRLWIGTQGKGLACELDGRISVWDTKHGFPDNEINGIVADDLGRLWINTRSGIHIMSSDKAGMAKEILPELETVRKYERSSLEVVSRGWPQAVKASDGHLWFAGPHAVYVVDPHDFYAATNAFKVELENILINGQPLAFQNDFGALDIFDLKKPLQLPSNLRTLEIEFTTPCLDTPRTRAVPAPLGSF